MKKALTSVLVMFLTTIFSTALNAQTNLVSNPSFESYSTCPNALGQIKRAIGWWDARPDAEYFNTCSTDTFSSGQHIVNVPLNWAGYRTPASGNAYAGVITSWANNEARENIGSQLITPLQIGTRYYGSFKVSLAGQANPSSYCGTNKLGILFSTTRYDSISPSPICSNCAQICSDSIVTDTLNWTRITGSFVADSNYGYISIGRFNLNSLTNFAQVAGSGYNAYYYIDDACISTDSVYAYTYNYTGEGVNNLNKEDEINFYPNPVKDIIRIDDKEGTISEVRIFNAFGALVRIYVVSNEQTFSINLIGLAQGIYNLVVYRNSLNQINHKLIKL